MAINLNVGCGNIILPCERPNHHVLVDKHIYDEPCVNADRNRAPGVDLVFNAFEYPWPFPDNHFDNVLLAHIVEHIPHEIRTARYVDPSMAERRTALAEAQDGWYAFMAEVYRVLKPGGVAHILSPYGWSQGAITDPTHTRLITEHTFTHSLNTSEPDAPFTYNNLGVKYELVGSPVFRINELFHDIAGDYAALQIALQTKINVAYEIYAKLRKLE
jgi:SAM-dependent methyltransferase